ncbi:hypothetical protein SCLCIDRAFT_1215803 [Scleroderma citrinum Foug A]|uniref:TPR-like protein n=1 Tax=Scleroderma citrinum Foug A TaxID=1036808 RepID=A0A0C3DZQ8_9AGAM|nr:hypothetical protein SCLCIDRAFT_1215803 [Scleroderma citrinum Foug A]
MAEDYSSSDSSDEDFERLIQDIRLGNDTTEPEWDFRVPDGEEFRDDLREAARIGKRKGTKRQTGPALSHQVRALLGEGNQAYIDNDLPEAMRIMREVIRIEPRATSGWTVLAQCYEDHHEPNKALQLRIIAAHLRHDPEEWDRLARQSRELHYNQQALYCYGKLYTLDPSNVDALWDRATLAKETNDLRIARHSLLAILKRFPHDNTVLTELRPVLIELSDLSLCTSLYQEAFDHNQVIRPLGQALDPSLDTVGTPAAGFGFIEVLVLADLYNTVNQYEHAVDTIRRGCRWLQGRASQKFWDVCQDDREYDIPPEEGGAVRQRYDDLQPGFYVLDINARHRLAISRIKMGDMEEGKRHANVVLAQDVLDYAALFVEIADAYFQQEAYDDARPIYEALGADPATSNLYVLLQVASCQRMQGDLRNAAEVYKQVVDADPSNNDARMKLAEIYEIMDEPRKALELVYQVIDSRKRRPNQPGDSTIDRSAPPQVASLFDEKTPAKHKGKAANKQGRLSLSELKNLEEEREKEVITGYKRIVELWPRILGDGAEETAEREWLLEAEKLVETFRETRNLFLTTKNYDFRGMFPRRRAQRQSNDTLEERMASRLELNERDRHNRRSKDDGTSCEKVSHFRGVSFDDWLRIFMQYAFILSKRGDDELAEEVLRHILMSNAYRSKETQVTIRLAIITCSIYVGNHASAVEQCRKLINTHQFNNEPLRILVSTLSSGLRATDSFISSTLQKHLFREVRLSDAAIRTPELLKWSSASRRYHLSSTKGAGEVDVGTKGLDILDEDGEDAGDYAEPSDDKKPVRLPTKNNPMPVMVHGQLCLTAKSYQSALFYLLHAYDYCPEDPMICLCLAISSLGRAMQRQSDNRHHLIAQGMVFLSHYRRIRKQDGDPVLPEIEFNFGRAFQQLGLHTLAVNHYEKTLQLVDEGKGDKAISVARQAAYNLSLIYITTGAVPQAENLYRRWLSI